MDCSPPGSSVHGILQARILEWVDIPFSRGSSVPDPGIEPGSPTLQADSLPSETQRKPFLLIKKNQKYQLHSCWDYTHSLIATADWLRTQEIFEINLFILIGGNYFTLLWWSLP